MPQNEPDPELVLMFTRDRMWSEMITVLVGLAAHRHPEELRKALAHVFDLKAVEEAGARAMAVLTDIQQQVRAARQEAHELQQRVGSLRNEVARVDRLTKHLEQRTEELA
jgi:hypothetical protein